MCDWCRWGFPKEYSTYYKEIMHYRAENSTNLIKDWVGRCRAEGKTSMCNHDFIYGGVKYHLKKGSDDSEMRYYYDWFYCRHCCYFQIFDLRLPGEPTSQPIKFQATPINHSQWKIEPR